MPGRRNTVAMNPLLRKGGAHERSGSAARRGARKDLQALVGDWYQYEAGEQSAVDDTAINMGLRENRAGFPNNRPSASL